MCQGKRREGLLPLPPRFSLHSVTIPEGVTKIGTNVFADCEGLDSVTIPKSLTKIHERVFIRGLFADGPALLAPHIPIADFEKEDKPGACLGFARLYLKNAEMDEKIRAGYLTYIKRQKKRLYRNAVRHEELLRLMLTEKMPVDIAPLLEECRKRKKTEAETAVLAYARENGIQLETVAG